MTEATTSPQSEIYPHALLTISEVAEILRLKPQTIRNQLTAGAKNKFPVKPIRIGSRAVRFRREDIEALINNQ
jgi:predicted DNA-binding transcriptional regulator AlpA